MSFGLARMDYCQLILIGDNEKIHFSFFIVDIVHEINSFFIAGDRGFFVTNAK